MVDPYVESIIVELFLNRMELVRLYSCLAGDDSDITLIARYCTRNVDFIAFACSTFSPPSKNYHFTEYCVLPPSIGG